MDLIRPLPKTVTVSGKKVPIRTDFRSWLRFDRALEEKELPWGKRLAMAFSAVLLEKKLPDDLGELFSALMSFYACGKKCASSKNGGGRVLSFSHDGDLIYAAFLSQYGVDLMRKNPHWYTFCAMLSGLSSHQVLSKIITYRSVNLADIESKAQRKFYQKMKAHFKLPDNRTAQTIEQDTANALSLLM